MTDVEWDFARVDMIESILFEVRYVVCVCVVG